MNIIYYEHAYDGKFSFVSQRPDLPPHAVGEIFVLEFWRMKPCARIAHLRQKRERAKATKLFTRCDHDFIRPSLQHLQRREKEVRRANLNMAYANGGR